MGKVCAIYGCLSNGKYDKDRHFYKFPSDELRRRQWIQATDRPELGNKSIENLRQGYYICDLHFQASDRLSKKLKSYAIPTLNLPVRETVNPSKLIQTNDDTYDIKPDDDTYDIKPDIKLKKEATTQVILTNPSTSHGTQTTQELYVNTPLKRKLQTNLKDCKRCKTFESQMKYSRSYKNKNVSPELQKLIETQFRLKRNSCGNKYEKDYKLFALNIYFASPLAYTVLGKTLNLPSERTLKRIKLDTGNKLMLNVFESLESKIKYRKDADKYCIICADQISLKRNLHYQTNEDKIIGFHEIDGIQTAEPASQAFVIMARGILSNWKQLIGYSFLAQSNTYKELSDWLSDIISKLINIGFNVVAFVSDQGSNFLNLASERGISAEKPYFLVNEKKIYYIFDVPHLVKAVRNTLINYDFEFLDSDKSKNTAKWEDIQKFYSLDSQRSYRLAPNLTESHINPNNFEKMKVNTATQVFSNTVAAGMSVLIECGKLDESANGTVKLIELMDKIFDVFDSSTLNDSNKLKNAFAYQNELLLRLELFLTTVTVQHKNKQNVTNSIKCLRGLEISFQSIKCLENDLQAEGFRFMYRKRLNKDPLENFFGAVRQHSGNCRKPTPLQFTSAFRNLFIGNSVNNTENANCSDDFNQSLITTDDICAAYAVKNEEQLQSEDSTTESSSVAVGTVDYRFDLPENNAFVFVCGYLLLKCFEIHKCEKMCNFIKQQQEQHSTDELFSNDEYGNENKTLVLKPSNNFVNCIKQMDNQVKCCFQQKIHDGVGKQILTELNNILFDGCCECFPNEYLKKLFVRFRIFNIIKFNNQCFRDKSLKRKYFSVSNI